MITLQQQIAVVGRELGMRRSVYPKWVASGRYTQEKADFEIECMSAAYETLKSLDKSSTQQMGLFQEEMR